MSKGKTSMKKWLLWGGIAAGAIAAGTGAYFLFFRKKNEEDQEGQSPIAGTTTAQGSTPTNAQMAAPNTGTAPAQGKPNYIKK